MLILESISVDPWVRCLIPPEPGILLGRSNSNLKITSKHVSREQVRIFLARDQSHVEVVSLGDKKGAWIVRHGCGEDNPEVLKPSGDRVQVGIYRT